MARFVGTLTLDNDSVSNENVASDAAIGVAKQRHRHKPGTNFDLAIGATPVAREEIIYVAKNAGTVESFHGLLNDTGTSTSVSFDLKKNGTTILSATADVTHSDADRTVKDGTISTPSFVADDVFSIALTVSSSTGAQGPFAWAEFDEAGQ